MAVNDVPPTVEAGLRAEFDRGESTALAVIAVLPYLLLAVCVGITLLQRAPELLLTLGLSVAAALWLLWFHTLHPRRHRTLHYAGSTLLAAALVAIAPWYGLFAFVGYPQAFLYLEGRRRLAGVAATALVMTTAFLGGVAAIEAEGLWWVWSAVGLVSVVLAGVVFHQVDLAYRRNDRQKQALVELHELTTRLETALAENAGLHARLLVHARGAGVLDERQRMARELHDTLAQGLAGILTQLQAAEQVLDDPAALRRHVRTATALTRDSLVEARRTVHAVEPAVLASAQLPDAIADVARGWSDVTGVAVELTTTGDARPMRTDVEVALLRTAQEALANVAKHANAGRVGLTLSYMEDVVTLDVRDDGAGFSPGTRRANGSVNGGFGLIGMRQRVQRLAGRLEVESEPGRGTAISASVPALPAEETP